MRRILVCLLVLVMNVSVFGTDAPPLPADLVLPAAITIDPNTGGWLEFAEASVTTNAKGDTRVVAGQWWNRTLAYAGLPDSIDGFGVLDRIIAAMQASGFTLTKRFDTLPPTAALHVTRNGHEYWAEVSVAFADDIRLRLLMPGPNPVTVSLTAPAAETGPTPTDAQDFAFFKRMPGSESPETSALGAPFLLAVPGHVEETQTIAADAIVKTYARPFLSNPQLLAVYHPALLAAGWTITHEVTEAENRDASIEAHFAKNGRNIWIEIRRVGDSRYDVRVADLGSLDFGSALTRDCHVTLDGVLFDFGKATLQPDSDGVLQKALIAVRQSPTLALEVQGHTDAVGSDASNQALSEARATAVRSWLIAKGADAQQLVAKGYGKSQPVDDNATAQGRARNRRVELACRK